MLSKETILKRVYGCEGLIDFQETESHIYAYDEQEDMHLYFKFLENLNFENLFDFGKQKVNNEKFFKILKECIDPLLFLMPEKIYFLSSEEELDNLLEEYPCQYMDFSKNMGINWQEDSLILINMNLINKLVIQNIEEEPSLSYEEELNRATWETLIHELRHMACNIGLIITKEEMPLKEGSEDGVEEYCRNIFDLVIEKHEDYVCFKMA